MRTLSSLFTGSILLIFLNSSAQVYNGDLTLNSQADVDAFNYTEVTGILFISSINSNITNLDGLSELTSVGKNLLISRQNFLQNLNGLANLQSVAGVLSIGDCPRLENIDGLSGLQSVDGLEISGQFGGNPRLKNINGLSNLVSCKSVTIENNDSLVNINPLANFSGFPGPLIIENNPMLTNLDALSNVTSVGQELHIGGLKLSNIDGLANVTSVGDLTIGGILATDEGAPLLTSIGALSNLATINGSLKIGRTGLSNLDALSKISLVHFLMIDGNSSLTNIDGLSGITKILAGLFITGNHTLSNFNGLSNVTSVGGRLDIENNSAITNLDAFSNLTNVGFDITINDNSSLTDFCGLHNLFNSGTIAGTIQILRNGANTVSIPAQQDLIVFADQGKCSAYISDATIGTPTVNGCLVPITMTHTSYPSGNVFPVGTTALTWTATDGAANTATSSRNIIVVDQQPPTISCPADITVSCVFDIPAVNVNSVTASDNCSAIVTHVSDDTTNKTCANRFTLTRTYKATDPAGNTGTCSQVITVDDDVPPQITGLSTSQTVLWPSNHTMRDITVNYTATDNCSNSTTTVTVTSNEPVNGTADGDTDPDWVVVDNHHIRLRAERAANGTGRVYTITVTINDGCSAPVSASTQVMVVHNITGPVSGKPFIVGSTVNFTGEFWDNPANKHTSKWLIDDNTSVKGSVIEPTAAKNGKATGGYKFSNTGVYRLQMNLTDQNGITSYANTNGDIEEIIVIYDPTGGYAYGGGWFNSPAGALAANKTTSGKVSYGFSVNYYKGATLPRGETEFEFKLAGLQYDALNFDYLSISGYKAVFAGLGKILGGQSGVNFTMYVIDGALDGTGVDKVRIKIYNKNTGYIYYDNEPGTSDAADPITPVGVNSTVIITGTSIVTRQQPVAEPENGNVLQVRAVPNPTHTNFSVTANSNNFQKMITAQVIDTYGRVIEVKHVIAGETIQLGDQFRPGTYMLRFTQGEQRQLLKVIKMPN